jgi:hypothetical protein
MLLWGTAACVRIDPEPSVKTCNQYWRGAGGLTRIRNANENEAEGPSDASSQEDRQRAGVWSIELSSGTMCGKWQDHSHVAWRERDSHAPWPVDKKRMR